MKGRKGVYRNLYIKGRSKFLLKRVVYLPFFMQGDSYIMKYHFHRKYLSVKYKRIDSLLLLH